MGDHVRDWKLDLPKNGNEPAKKIFSTFIITMNTNKSWAKLNKAEFNRYKHFFNTLLTPDSISRNLLYQVNRKNDKITRRIPQEEILEFLSYLKPEIGARFHRFHIHLTINLVIKKTDQWGLPKFNASLIREIYISHFGEKLHLNVKGINDNAKAMKYFVGKSKEM